MGAGGESHIYRDLLRFRPEGLTLNAWAVKAGVSRAVWADMRRHGNPSRRTLEKLLSVAGSSIAEFEALRLGGDPHSVGVASDRLGEPGNWGWRAAPLQPLPLLSTTLGGEWRDDDGIELVHMRPDQLLDRLPRPPSLAGDPQAYAITIVGRSMLPRFRPGRRVAVSPRASAAIGDDVLVRLRISQSGAADNVPALIGELVRRTGDFVELKQFNPELIFQVPTADVEGVAKILGELV